jgi:hypothetical protein
MVQYCCCLLFYGKKPTDCFARTLYSYSSTENLFLVICTCERQFANPFQRASMEIRQRKDRRQIFTFYSYMRHSHLHQTGAGPRNFQKEPGYQKLYSHTSVSLSVVVRLCHDSFLVRKCGNTVEDFTVTYFTVTVRLVTVSFGSQTIAGCRSGKEARTENLECEMCADCFVSRNLHCER